MARLHILNNHLIGLAALVTFAEKVNCYQDLLLFIEAFGIDQFVNIKTQIHQELRRSLEAIGIFHQSLRIVPHRILFGLSLARASTITLGKSRQCPSQAFDHAVVIDDQSMLLAAANPINAGDGLHQGMALHRLVQIQSGQAFHVEAGQPHRANNRDAERVVCLLELFFQVAFDHLFAVRRDIQRLITEILPLGKLRDLALLL